MDIFPRYREAGSFRGAIMHKHNAKIPMNTILALHRPDYGYITNKA